MQCFVASASGTQSSEASGASGNQSTFVVNGNAAHVAEATIASPTLRKLESTATGWLFGGVAAFLIGLVIFIVGTANLSAGTIQWGIILMGVGAFFVQFGFLFFILGRHARVQAEVALYVKNNS